MASSAEYVVATESGYYVAGDARVAGLVTRPVGPRGNPQARNLFEVIGQLQRIEGLHFELSLRAAS